MTVFLVVALAMLVLYGGSVGATWAGRAGAGMLLFAAGYFLTGILVGMVLMAVSTR